MADEAKAKGNAAFSVGNYTEPIRHFTDAINLAPTNHVLYSNRSAAYTSLNQYSEALTDAQKTVDSRSSIPHEHYMKMAKFEPMNQSKKTPISSCEQSRSAFTDLIILIAVISACGECYKSSNSSSLKNGLKTGLFEAERLPPGIRG
ncbi:hypothetical protein LXL04_027947 [Taraxacum kok-saghyz]